MKKNNILKSFSKENMALMFVIKKNYVWYYFLFSLNLIFIIFGILSSLMVISGELEIKDSELLSFISVSIILPIYINYIFQAQKEQFLILYSTSEIPDTSCFYFYLKRRNRRKKLFDLREYGVISISLKNDNEILLITEEKLPWGNRSILISEEFCDRKEELLEFLKLVYLK